MERIGFAQSPRHRGRIDDVDISSMGFDVSRSSWVPGTRSISPKEQRMTSGNLGEFTCGINQFNGSDTPRTSGAMDESDAQVARADLAHTERWNGFAHRRLP